MKIYNYILFSIILSFSAYFSQPEAKCESGTIPQPLSGDTALSEKTVLVFKSGTLLGKIIIKKTDIGTLTIENEDRESQLLKERWEREIKAGHITVSMHLPGKNGKRGPYGARIYKPDQDDYLEGVEYFLISEGYGVKVE